MRRSSAARPEALTRSVRVREPSPAPTHEPVREFTLLSKREKSEKAKRQPITPEQLAKSGTEHGTQAAFFQWIALEGRLAHSELALMYAVPNGDERSPSVGARLQAEGVKAGVPDTVLPVARGPWHGLYVEFKRPALKPKQLVPDVEHGCYLNDSRSEHQRKFGRALLAQGYAVKVVYSWQEARDVVLAYLSQGDFALVVPFPTWER